MWRAMFSDCFVEIERMFRPFQAIIVPYDVMRHCFDRIAISMWININSSNETAQRCMLARLPRIASRIIMQCVFIYLCVFVCVCTSACVRACVCLCILVFSCSLSWFDISSQTICFPSNIFGPSAGAGVCLYFFQNYFRKWLDCNSL